MNETMPAVKSPTAQPPKEAQAIVTGDAHEIAWEIAQRSPARNLLQIWKAVEGELKFAPEYAEKAWYSIPYKNSNTGKTEPVEGTGVHGATVMARHYGHCSFGGGILKDDGDKVVCRGIFKDHKTNVDSYKEVVVHKYQMSRHGKTYRLAGKHWDNAIQSGISKAMRNAILHGLPEGIKSRFFLVVKKLTLADKSKGAVTKTVEQRITDAKARFIKDFKLTTEIFDDYVAELSNVETPEDLLAHLKGLYNALRSGEESTQEVFGVDPAGKRVMSKPTEKEKGPDELPGV